MIEFGSGDPGCIEKNLTRIIMATGNRQKIPGRKNWIQFLFFYFYFISGKLIQFRPLNTKCNSENYIGMSGIFQNINRNYV